MLAEGMIWISLYADDNHISIYKIILLSPKLKKIFAISLLSIYLFSSTELPQLLKMPLLVEHFIEHREQNQQITLWQFLYLHYVIDHGRDADYRKDMQLPFKTHDNCVTSVLNVYLPTQKIIVINPVRFIQNQHFRKQETLLQSTFLANIWQPPRIC